MSLKVSRLFPDIILAILYQNFYYKTLLLSGILMKNPLFLLRSVIDFLKDHIFDNEDVDIVFRWNSQTSRIFNL